LNETVVIAGAGHAAGQLVVSLRVGDEPYLPYQRPPLSKKFLAGAMDADRLLVKPAGFYEETGVELRLDTSIAAIDRNKKCLRSTDDDEIPYDKLVLGLGSRARKLPVEGAKLQGVHYLRSIADVAGIREDFQSGRRLVVIGAGYIGLEVAAVAQQAGLVVTVIEMADRVMSRVVSPEISDFYQIEHTNQGVRFRLSTSVSALKGKKRVKSVTTSDDEEIPADLVVIGVGILPNTELATAAGLDVENGIVVDDHCRTGDPDIYAMGDCTSHPNAIYDRRLRLESVHNALEQAKTTAANICGKDASYCQVPWFWSDQYDLKLQIAGLSEGYDGVAVRGNPAERSFSCLYLMENRLIAVDAINAPRDFVQSKQLIADRNEIDHGLLDDATVALKDLAI
jgi:3-phenylpropionate/trans-cinnamate dioxygenase ferredoxin reductase subunit